MADKKFSELSAAGTLAGTELVAITQSSATVRTTAAAIGNTATSVSLSNTGLKVLDSNASHTLTIQPGANLTADRVLTITTDDSDQTLDISGNVTLVSGTGATLTGTETLTNKTLATLRTSVQTLSGAGAIDITTGVTRLTTTGVNALTLADGAEGQMKMIVMLVDGGDGTLTPTNLGNGSTITFNDAGDSVLLIFLATDWWIVSNNGCTVA